MRCDSYSWKAYGLMEEQADKQMISRYGDKYYSAAIDKMLWEFKEKGTNCAWDSERIF